MKKLRPHLKLLTGDFLTAQRAARDQPNLDPTCALCGLDAESVTHIIVKSRALAGVRDRIIPELMNAVAKVQPSSQILNQPSEADLTQFILDCTSVNLDNNIRVPNHNPGISEIFRLSRDLCFALTNERKRLLNSKMTPSD